MNKGTSQKSRTIEALDTDFISIDEESLLDLVNYTLNYSKHVNFYNLHKKAYKNWESLLLNDSAFILATIAFVDIERFKVSSKLNGVNEKENEIKTLQSKTKEIYDVVLNWHNRLKKTDYTGTILTEIEKLILSEERRNSISEEKKGNDFIKETYDNIYGNILFLKEKVINSYEKEVFNSKHHPHIALLLAFFKLFQFAQNDINTITQKHLDYYYHDLLQQNIKNHESYSAIIAPQLQEDVDEIEISEGDKFEMFFEGENQLSFRANSNGQINKANITELKTLFKSDYYPFGTQIDNENFALNINYEADIPISAGLKKSEEKNELHEYPASFGEEILQHQFSENNADLSEIGFLISSPALILENGRQLIKLKLSITPDSYHLAKELFDGLLYQEIEKADNYETDKVKHRTKVVSKFFADAFVVYGTGENGWVEIENCNTKVNRDEFSLNIHLYLNGQTDNLIPFSNELHTGNFNTMWPCIRVILNNNAQFYSYKILKNIVVKEINIKTTVLGVSNLVLSNSTGNIDSSIPFTPFGPNPVIGSYLRIQNSLILQSNLSYLKLNLNWIGLPINRGGFKKYYGAYPAPVENSEFKALVQQDKNSVGNEKNRQEIELFNTQNEYLLNSNEIKVNLDNFKNNNVLSGKNRNAEENSLFIILNSPENAFGHQIFPDVYAEAALKRSRFRKAALVLPNQPYTPLLERLTVDYCNTAREIMSRKQDEKSSDIKLVHIYPFGHVQVFPGSVKSESYLFPQINHKGNLFIGLKGVSPGNIISIGFDLIPAVYIHTVINIPKVKWEYLVNNEWIPLADLLLEDSTNGLIKTGIVKIVAPVSIQLDNSRMARGKFWIRAVYDGNEVINSRIKKVFTQAVKISTSNIHNSEDRISVNNKVDKINAVGKVGITQITGPFEFKKNNLKENQKTFYSRVSERLRHKNRAVSNWDFERLVLNQFGQINKVRVYGRNSHPNEIVKGSKIQIVVIPKNNMVNGSRRYRSRVDFSALVKIKEYVSQFVSPYVNVEVSNPVYEQLKVKCSVRFVDNQKKGYYRNVLNRELIDYLSPDIESENDYNDFDESISKTEILNFIESKNYVDIVSKFSVLQLVEVQGKYKIIDTARILKEIDNAEIEKISELRTISPYAILTSAPGHQIEYFEDDETSVPEKSGIGDFSIDTDFVISSDGEYY